MLITKLITQAIKTNRILLLLGISWIIFNVYFLPFAVWTLGIVRPWFIINGLLPYKDFTWFRTPFDIFLLSFWYRIFGIHESSYQLFVFFLLIVSSILLFYISRLVLGKHFIFAFLFYSVFLFPLFLNTEEGELLLGALNLLVLLFIITYLNSQKLKWLFISGIVSGVIYLTKQNDSFIVLALLVLIAYSAYKSRYTFGQWLNRMIIFIAGLSIPILLMLSYFFFRGGLSDFLYYTIYFVLGPYVRQQPSLIHGDGLWIAAGFIVLLVPFVAFWKYHHLKPQIVMLFVLMVITSLFSLLPSFLSYRAFPAFGFVAIVVGYNFILLQKKTSQKIIKIFVIASFVIFLIFTFRFIQSYVIFIQENGIAFGQHIKDYGEEEQKIAKWIITNTSKNERIVDFGNEMIYVLSDRLPKHKYIEPFPYLLQPYETTSKLFINDPPKIVVYDTSLPEIHKGLDSWPFIPFMKKNYKEVDRYGETLVIYQYHP